MPDTTEGANSNNIGTSLMRSVNGHDGYREDQMLQRLPILIILEPEVYGTKWMARGVKRTQEPMVDIKIFDVCVTNVVAKLAKVKGMIEPWCI